MTATSVSWQQHQHIQHRTSATPMADYLHGQSCPGTSDDGDHVVLSRHVLESLPLTTQQHAVHVLQQIQQHHPDTPPTYRVTPLRWAPINSLDAARLAEVGITPELGEAGELVYYDHPNQRWIPPEETPLQVLVSTESDELRNTSTRR